jgi:hypothetical protein
MAKKKNNDKKKPKTKKKGAIQLASILLGSPNTVKIMAANITSTATGTGWTIMVPVAFNPAIACQGGAAAAGSPFFTAVMMNPSLDQSQDLSINGVASPPMGGTGNTRGGTLTFNMPSGWLGQPCVITVYFFDGSSNLLASDSYQYTQQ